MVHFIEETLDDIGDAVRPVADAVGDVIRPVADVAGDVIRPVADAAADVLRPVGEAILRSDELRTVINVAAVATGNTWAVPIINGAKDIDDGADPGDVFKNIAIQTVTAGVADAVGEVASAALTDQVGSTMANFVTDASINVVTNGGDIGAAVLDAGLSSTGAVSNTVGKITDAIGLDTASEIGKNLKDSFTEGVTASLLGGDGIQAATVAAMSNFLKPMVGRIGDYTPEVKEDVARVLSTGFTASAQGKNVYSAINNELGSIATEDLRNTVKETVLNYLDPAEKPPSTIETFAEEAKKEEPKEEIVQGDPLTEAQDLYEKIDAPPPVSQPLTTTYIPPGGVPGEKAPTPSIPELTPEADKDIPSAPKSPFSPITERDLSDPSGKPYGVDTTPAEKPKSKTQEVLSSAKEVVEAMSPLTKKALNAPLVETAKDLGVNLMAGGVEETALIVGGIGRGADEAAEIARRNIMAAPTSTPLQLSLMALDVADRFFPKKNLYPIDRGAFGSINIGKNLTKDVKEYLMTTSDELKEFISPEMALRQAWALPKQGTTIEEIRTGKAVDRLGRPFGKGDPLATFMNGSQEFADIMVDMTLVALNPVLGGIAAFTSSSAAAYDESASEIEKTINDAYKTGELQKTDSFKALAEKYGSEEKALQLIKSKADDYAKVAGSVGGLTDLIMSKLALATGVKDNLGVVTSAVTKVTGGTLTEMTTEGLFEQRLTNEATKFLGTDPFDQVGEVMLLAAVPGGTAGTIGATTDIVGSANFDFPSDAQAKFETIDPTTSKPLTTAYTPPDVSLPGTSPVKPVITPETVTSEDIAIAVQTLEDAGIRSKDIQEDILTLAGFLPPKTQGSTVGTTADTTAIIDPLTQIPVGSNTTLDARTDARTDTTTDTTVNTRPTTTTTTTTTTTPAGLGLGLDLGLPSQLGLGLQQVKVETPDPAEIDYFYDFSSIFATPEQEKLFTRPYRTYNNRVQDSTDELLRLIGGMA